MLAEYGHYINNIKRDISTDAAQDTACRFVQSEKEGRILDSGLFAVMAKNRRIDIIRRQAKCVPFSSLTGLGGIEPPVDAVSRERDPAEMMAIAEEFESVLSVLDPDDRQLLDLRFRQGYTPSEIAQAFGIPLGTIASRIHRIIKRLRRLFGVTA